MSFAARAFSVALARFFFAATYSSAAVSISLIVFRSEPAISNYARAMRASIGAERRFVRVDVRGLRAESRSGTARSHGGARLVPGRGALQPEGGEDRIGDRATAESSREGGLIDPVVGAPPALRRLADRGREPSSDVRLEE